MRSKDKIITLSFTPSLFRPNFTLSLPVPLILLPSSTVVLPLPLPYTFPYEGSPQATAPVRMYPAAPQWPYGQVHRLPGAPLPPSPLALVLLLLHFFPLCLHCAFSLKCLPRGAIILAAGLTGAVEPWSWMQPAQGLSSQRPPLSKTLIPAPNAMRTAEGQEAIHCKHPSKEDLFQCLFLVVAKEVIIARRGEAHLTHDETATT